MRRGPRTGNEKLSPELERQLDQLCDRFEAAWKAGQQAPIEGFLADISETGCGAALRELLFLELAYRIQAGEKPILKEYQLRFPEHAEVVSAVFREGISVTRLGPDNSETSGLSGANSLDQADAGETGPPLDLGRYQITAEVGRGGFGVVYKALDSELQRDVAIKVPHRHCLATPGYAQTFLREARILASLDHPGIVPVYDVAQADDGVSYVVSKFVEGMDLRARIKQARLSCAESVEVVARVAEALHYAHQRGLVHRDIKPANILLDVHGNPVVADFGLALREEDFGTGPLFAGTAAYMSPEQARGEGHLVDARTDVYSLGVVFYELLTGLRPFRAKSRSELLDLINTRELRPPRQLDDKIPKELDRICLKALGKRASERYSTAIDFAEDLRHWQGPPVEKPALNVQVGMPPVSNVPPSLSGTIPPAGSPSEASLIKVIPKGLRSFEAEDADFFLDLLPGPRGRDGLPDSILFWKTHLEETDAERTFRVGLIYGPSGSGKSSLVKAGLLPRLGAKVITVYVEATPNETECRLLNGLRKRCPAMPAKLGLIETLAWLRRAQNQTPGRKILIVLDQFEQWLHAKQDELNPELVQALRQCDGQHLQCILLVRDDFWMAITRFMRELEEPLLENRNSMPVDLFNPRHARKVLIAFGRAFGAVTDREVPSEQDRFLDQAVEGLAQQGKVIPVRLALFAEMVKGRRWTPTTLKEVGGTEGIGVTFLEETFNASTAPPQHRIHQKAARAVLQALLPDQGTTLKGQMKSHPDLLKASGYAQQPREFDDLLRILDTELRLVTPTEGGPPTDSPAATQRTPFRYYQLTHDYLVHSLRDWLTRRQKETRRGRAELQLADRTVAWNSRRENRQLPSFPQWVELRVLTQKKTWTEPQRKMMQKAGRYHAKRALILGVVLLIATVVGLEVRRANRAAELVQLLQTADIAQVPEIVKEIGPFRYWADPRLRKINERAGPDSPQKLNTSVALLPGDPGQAEYLYGRMLDAPPHVARIILDFFDLYPTQGDRRDRIMTLLASVADERLASEANEDDKEKLAKRQANAAVALLRMDQPERVWPLLKHSQDPRGRSYLIHRLGPLGVDARVVLDRLEHESEITIRRALLLGLGEFGENEYALDDRESLITKLRELYRSDPDAGLHGAVDWLLRQLKQESWLEQINQEWAVDKQQRKERLDQIQQELAREGPPSWYVNGQGQTMVVIPAQTKFLMGSPKNEAERLPDDQVQQPQVIGRTFAIAVKSVTVDQFRRSPKGHDYVSPLAPKGDCPVIAVTWYMAAEYCNWLSVMEGLERCYEPNKDGEYQAGMKLVPDYLNRTGYRLATQAEWECACRAGAKTSRYYGESIDLLGKYAWYVGNSGHRPWPVASLKPNDWGLFDVHGNVWTWCQDDSANGTDSEFRPIRGGSFVDAPAEVRAACRVLTVPMRESPYVGLRPARTFR